MKQEDIKIGAKLRVIILDKVGGKPLGFTRLVKVLGLEYCWKPKGVLRTVDVVTLDNPPRRERVSPKYLLPFKDVEEPIHEQ